MRMQTRWATAALPAGSFFAGFVDGMAGFLRFFQQGAPARRWHPVNDGIAGDWKAVGGDIRTALATYRRDVGR
jgi:hypothetical protein